MGEGEKTRLVAWSRDLRGAHGGLRHLKQDHSMIAHLLVGLQAAVARAAPPAELDRHVAGVAAIMESHTSGTRNASSCQCWRP